MVRWRAVNRQTLPAGSNHPVGHDLRQTPSGGGSPHPGRDVEDGSGATLSNRICEATEPRCFAHAALTFALAFALAFAFALAGGGVFALGDGADAFLAASGGGGGAVSRARFLEAPDIPAAGGSMRVES